MDLVITEGVENYIVLKKKQAKTMNTSKKKHQKNPQRSTYNSKSAFLIFPVYHFSGVYHISHAWQTETELSSRQMLYCTVKYCTVKYSRTLPSRGTLQWFEATFQVIHVIPKNLKFLPKVFFIPVRLLSKFVHHNLPTLETILQDFPPHPCKLYQNISPNNNFNLYFCVRWTQ